MTIKLQNAPESALSEPTGSEFLTHHAPHCFPPWLAIHRPSALACLDGYDLTEDEQNDIGAMMAGYCRLLDEAGLCHYGETEKQAIGLASLDAIAAETERLGLYPNDQSEARDQ